MKAAGGVLVLCLSYFLFSGVPLRAGEPAFSVTAYTNNTGLIRQVQTATLKQGVSEFKLPGVPALIEPASVQVRSLTSPEALSLLEQRFAYDLGDTGRLLHRYLGRNIQVTLQEGEVQAGTLLQESAGDLVLELADRSLRVVKSRAIAGFLLPGLPDGLSKTPALTWLLQCDRPGEHELEALYLTGGLQWSAHYVARLNPAEDRLRILGWASIDNQSGADYPQARLSLVAGDVRRESPPPVYRPMEAERDVAMMAKAGPGFAESPVFEYHLYRLDRRTTLADRETTQIPLFDPLEVKVQKSFSYDGQRDQEKVRAILVFQNQKTAGLGIPLPGGKVQIYKLGKDNSQLFVGEDEVAHVPEGEEVKLSVGYAFDIVGERTVIETRQMGKRSRQETVEVQLRNRKDTAITVTVIEHPTGSWEFVGATPPIKKKQANQVEFELKVPPGSEEKFQVTVLYNW